jgi:hypothetical protein
VMTLNPVVDMVPQWFIINCDDPEPGGWHGSPMIYY